MIVVGHSFGSVYATAYAAKRPERVKGLVLLAPYGVRAHRGLRASPNPRLLRRLMNLPLVGGPFSLKVVEGFEKFGFKNVSINEARLTIATIDNFRFSAHVANLEAVRVPTFISWTGDDDKIEAEVVQELDPLLPTGPRLFFETGGHNVQKTYAVELVDGIAAWLEELD